jgi:hypothetical protein
MKGRSKHFLRLALAEQAFLEADAMAEHILANKFATDSHLYQACVAGLVTSYTRPFTESEGLGRLPKDIDDFTGSADSTTLDRTHTELMLGRNKVLAHFDLKYGEAKFQAGEYHTHPGDVVLCLHDKGFDIQTQLFVLLPAALIASRQLIAHQRAKIQKLQSDFAIEVLKSTRGQLGNYVFKTS